MKREKRPSNVTSGLLHNQMIPRRLVAESIPAGTLCTYLYHQIRELRCRALSISCAKFTFPELAETGPSFYDGARVTATQEEFFP